MDRKSIAILAVAIGLLFLMSPLVDHFFPPKPVPVTEQAALTNGVPAENQPVSATAPRLLSQRRRRP